MSKKIILTMIAVIVAIPLIAFASGNLRYEAHESGARIFFNGREISFQLPVVVINGNTYVPLREVAEKADVKVEWHGKKQVIRMTDDVQDVDAREIFSNFFKFALPETAEVLNYDYFKDRIEEGMEEPHFLAKISFPEKDLEYIKGQFSGWVEDDGGFLKVFYRYYDWWDLTDINETICAHHAFRSGEYMKTIGVYAWITKVSEDQYHLYVKH